MPALTGIATMARANTVAQGDLVGRWKCVDLSREGRRSGDSAVLGAILELSGKHRFTWRAEQASRYLPKRMSGRWSYDHGEELLTLRSNPLLSTILDMSGDVAIVEFESNRQRLVLRFKSFGQAELYSPEVYAFQREAKEVMN